MHISDEYNFPLGLDIVPLRIQRSKAGSSSKDLGQEDQTDPQKEWIEKYGIAGRVWEAAPYLAQYLTPPSPSSSSLYIFSPPCSLFLPSSSSSSITPPVILELGSGNGFLASEHLVPLLPPESSIILTDLSEVTPLLEENISLARSAGRIPPSVEVDVRAVKWGNLQDVRNVQQGLKETGKRFTHILCSDLVYFTHLLEPLLKTLLWVTNEDTDENVEIIVGYKVRSMVKETPFWESFGVYFSFEAVDCQRRPGEPEHAQQEDKKPTADEDEEEEDRLFIFLARRKRGSIRFGGDDLPENLMQGQDSQFEEMLMLRSIADGEW